MTTAKPSRLSPQKLQALREVDEGRVQFGAEYPRMARRRPGGSSPVLLLDGAGLHGAAHATYRALLEAGLIRERVEDVATVTAAAEIRTHHSITGDGGTYELPERQVPADPGWRVAVELTDSGRAALGAGGRSGEGPVISRT